MGLGFCACTLMSQEYVEIMLSFGLKRPKTNNDSFLLFFKASINFVLCVNRLSLFG